MREPTLEMIAGCRNEKQRERLTAWRELGTAAKAAEELGCTKKAIEHTKRHVCKRLGIKLEIGSGGQAPTPGTLWDTKLSDEWLMRAI